MSKQFYMYMQIYIKLVIPVKDNNYHLDWLQRDYKYMYECHALHLDGEVDREPRNHTIGVSAGMNTCGNGFDYVMIITWTWKFMN